LIAVLAGRWLRGRRPGAGPVPRPPAVPRRFTGHTDSVWAVAFAPDGSILSAGIDGTVRRWDGADGRELLRLDAPPPGTAALAVGPDGTVVCTGGLDGSAALWDLQTGREERRFGGHAGGVLGVALLPDGRLLTAGLDGTIRVRDWATGREAAAV